MSDQRLTPTQGPPLQGPRPPAAPPHQGPPSQGPPQQQHAPQAPPPLQAPHPPQQPHPTMPNVKLVPPAAPKPKDSDLEPISLVEESGTAAPSKIKAFGTGSTVTAHAYKRQPFVTGQGAVRVKSFHGRLSEEGIAYLDEKINEWLDVHPEVEVKFVTTTIGQFEGKIREPALVVNVWY